MRIRKVLISAELISECLTAGYEPKFSIVKGLPPGAVLTGFTCPDPHTWALHFFHKSFDDIPKGGEIPLQEVIAERRAL